MNKDLFISVERAIQELQQGKMIILVDDEDRENEGDLVLAAEKVTPEAINFMSQFARGLICLSMAAEDFDRLNIPLMPRCNSVSNTAAFGISFEAAAGVTTGISAQDRARTIQVACDPNSGPQDIAMPGHMFPLRAESHGVLQRKGHTEASIDLMRIAKLKPAAVICEIMKADGSMARRDDLLKFAQENQMFLLSIEDLIQYRLKHEKLMMKVAEAQLPIDGLGLFQITSFQNLVDGSTTIALTSPVTNQQPPLVRIHSECLTGDIFKSSRCDCGTQLQISLARIAQEGGVLLYLKQEGRGIGLSNKIKAYALQDNGLDTVEANHHLGYPEEMRDYGIAAQILKELGYARIRLMTNNPHKIKNLSQYNVEVVERVAIETLPTPENIHYLRTKQEKLGHLFSKII